MKSKRKNNTTKTGSFSKDIEKKNSVNEQFMVLPLFPSAPKPCSSSSKSRISSTLSSNILRNSDEIIMSPCNTIILQSMIDGKIQMSRTQKERDKNPDRLSLDRRALKVFPILVGETKLRLLSLQHNLLTKLERSALLCLPHLVFLDIYNNQLENITPLECLRHLRVLLLGKNRIRMIDGLSNMIRLEVLDLHGNQINEIKNLKNQKELKVLNLAGNEIKSVGMRDLEGLGSLQELNLRRNHIKYLSGFEETPQLFKLFLSNNDINSIDELSGITKLQELKELSLDGNPIISSEDCIFYVISYMPCMQIFGQTKITDDIRKVAKVWRLRREFNERTSNSLDTVDSLRSIFNVDDPSRARSASENRLTSARKRVDSFNAKTNALASSTGKLLNRAVPCSAKPTRNTTFRRSTFTKRKNTSIDSYAGSETSVEYFCLPPILTASLAGSVDEPNTTITVRPNDPSTSMDSNKCGRSAKCDSDSSEDKNDESSDSLNESEEDIPPTQIRNDNATYVKNDGSLETFVAEKLKISTESKHSIMGETKVAKNRKCTIRTEKVREQGGDYLVQISGRYLTVAGKNSAKYVDKVWSTEKANDVTTVKFTRVPFNSLCSIFGRLKCRFPHVEHLAFDECEFNLIGQLNALADVQGLTSIYISTEKNAIGGKEWRSYAVFRLHHWGLQTINNIPITGEEIETAKEEYKGLAEMVLWSLPESLLTPLLNKLRLQVDRNVSAKKWLHNADPALRDVICKEALQWRPPLLLSHNEIESRERGKDALFKALESGCQMVLKLRKLNAEWKSIMIRLVEDTLRDYSHIDEYTKERMNEIEFS